MGYYVAVSGSPVGVAGTYYEGDKAYPDDVETARRPHPTMTWNFGSGIWEHNLAELRAYTKTLFFQTMEADLAGALAALNIGNVDLIAQSSAIAEINFIAAYPGATADECPLLEGYATHASITKAAAAALIDSDAQSTMTIIGTLYAYKVESFAAIDASSDPAVIMAVVYSRP